MPTHARRALRGTLLVLMIVCGACEGREAGPVLVLAEGDYVSPRFSPDGRALAFAEPIPLGNGRTSPRIWVIDLGIGERHLLLHADSAMRYHPSHAPQLLALEWEDPETVFARLSSGNDSATEVLFDRRTGATRAETRIKYGEDPLRPEQLELLERLGTVRPQWSSGVREKIARNAVILGGERIIFQRKYQGDVQDHLWLADLGAGSFRVLRSIPVGPRAGFMGAVVHYGNAALLVRGHPDSQLLFFDGEAVRDSITFRSRAPPRLELRRTGPARTTFLLQLRNRHGWGNKLLTISEDGIMEVVKHKRLFDADVSPDGAWLALNLSDGDQRWIQLEEASQ